MKTMGIILTAIGLIGLILFGIKAINDSESFHLFGMDVAVSHANWTPLLICGFITLMGLIAYKLKD